MHPRAVVQLLDVIVSLAKKGVQFFISTHLVFSPDSIGRWIPEQLKDGIPKDNKIIDESIRLFEEELEASF